jgi:HEAT repeat protein
MTRWLSLLFVGVLSGAPSDVPSPAKEARVAELIRDLATSDRELQEAALGHLGTLGPAAKDAIPGIFQYLQRVTDDSWAASWREFDRAVHVLTQIGPSGIPVLVEALDDPDDAVANAAQQVLGSFGSEAVPALTAVLREDVPNGQRHRPAMAAGALTRMEPRDARPAFEALLSAFCEARLKVARGERADLNGGVRVVLLQAIAHSGSKEAAVVQILVDSLEDPDWTVRVQAIRSLRETGAHGEAVALGLARSLEGTESVVQSHAARALQDMGPDARPALKALIGAAASKESSIRNPAVEALGNIGPEAKEAGPVLERLFQKARSDSDESLAALVQKSLDKIQARTPRP